MRRPLRLGIASTGVHHVAKIASHCNCIFQTVDQQNDVGIDAYLEFIVEQETTGCCIALQIKSGSSYCDGEEWRIPADAKHINYWRSHSLPVCGVVYNPARDSARWVDISAFLSAQASFTGTSLPVPATNDLTVETFGVFQKHFLASRKEFSNDAHFGKSIQNLCQVEQIGVCGSALRALFSFHRSRAETWFLLINLIPALRGHPLLRNLVIVLSHAPGHGDIFWHPKNIITEDTRRKAEEMMRRYLSRESVISLLTIVDPETGFERGSIGQCVLPIVQLAPDVGAVLRSIILDRGLAENLRFWAVLLLINFEQHNNLKEVISIIKAAKPDMAESSEQVAGLLESLKRGDHILFW